MPIWAASITPEVGQELCKRKHKITFYNLRSLDKTVISSLSAPCGMSKAEGDIGFHALQPIEPTLFEASFKNYQVKPVWLDPNVEQLKILSKTKTLKIHTIATLNVQVATALAGLDGVERLVLQSVTHVEPGAAAALSGFGGQRIAFARVQSIDKESAQGLAQFAGKELDLPNLKRITPEAAVALAQFKGRVSHPVPVERLDPTSAQRIIASHFRDQLELPKLVTIDVPTAQVFAQASSKHLSIRIARLEPEVAQALVSGNLEWLTLDLQGPLEPEVARALVSGQLKRLDIDHRGPLGVATARELGGKLHVTLNSSSLTIPELKALAKADPASLMIRYFPTLDEEMARVVATFKQVIFLKSVFYLDRALATQLSAFQGQSLTIEELRITSKEALELIAAHSKIDLIRTPKPGYHEGDPPPSD
ncbi:MAG: hypothetical protein AAFX99_08690 [Myxococcota bacterium]